MRMRTCVHPELIAAERAIALTDDKLRAIQDEALRVRRALSRDSQGQASGPLGVVLDRLVDNDKS